VREQLADGPKPGALVEAAAAAAEIPERSLIIAADALGVCPLCDCRHLRQGGSQHEQEEPIHDEDRRDDQTWNDARYEHGCAEGYLHTIQRRLNSREFLNIGRNNSRRTSRSVDFSQHREIAPYE
jgi:hypothetical protein